MNTVNINVRDIKISYDIDKVSVSAIAEKYNITHKEAKEVVRAVGLNVRMEDAKAPEVKPTYTINIIDNNNISTPLSSFTKTTTSKDTKVISA